MHNTIISFYECADALNAAGASDCFAEQVELRFGNAEPLLGKAAAQAAFSDFYSAIKGMKHEFINTWEQGNATLLESQVLYTREDQSTLSVPAFSVIKLNANKISEIRIYIDLSQLFA